MRINANRIVVLPQGSKGPFGSLPILLRLAILHKLLRVLIDAKIGEVDEPLTDILGLDVVLIGGEAGESLLEHVDLEGIIAGDEDVYAEIVLEVIDEVRVADVLGH